MYQWLRLHAPNVGGPDLIPGQGTRSHMLQLGIRLPLIKILHTITRTQNRQIHFKNPEVGVAAFFSLCLTTTILKKGMVVRLLC